VFHSDGPDEVWSVDGHDKIKRWGFRIHGCVDVYSRYMVWLRVGKSATACDVLSYYLDAIEEIAEKRLLFADCTCYFYLFSLTVAIPQTVQADRGTETVELFGVHTTFHDFTPNGSFDDCWKYGKSVHNQKIECFWSQLVKQWIQRWRDEFRSLESENLWTLGDNNDNMAILYIYMPIVRREVESHREEYNSYPMRKNHLSRLPSGPPEDNYLSHVATRDNAFSVPIDLSLIGLARTYRLGDGFDADEYLEAGEIERLDTLLEHSPIAPYVDVANAREQYLYIRNRLHFG
jgi:hypothetical protein